MSGTVLKLLNLVLGEVLLVDDGVEVVPRLASPGFEFGGRSRRCLIA